MTRLWWRVVGLVVGTFLWAWFSFTSWVEEVRSCDECWGKCTCG